MKKPHHSEISRWYTIGFHEGRQLGARFDPPYEKHDLIKDAYKRGYTDARNLEKRSETK